LGSKLILVGGCRVGQRSGQLQPLARPQGPETSRKGIEPARHGLCSLADRPLQAVPAWPHCYGGLQERTVLTMPDRHERITGHCRPSLPGLRGLQGRTVRTMLDRHLCLQTFMSSDYMLLWSYHLGPGLLGPTGLALTLCAQDTPRRSMSVTVFYHLGMFLTSLLQCHVSFIELLEVQCLSISVIDF
jgi:hypothetical protein